MVELEKQLENALNELRKTEKRKFDQTVDLAINLKKFDLRKSQFNILVSLPYKIKDKKVCAFFEIKNSKVDTITPNEFKKYNDKKEMKKLVKKYDFFIAQASVMPQVATTFGRVLGPAGKMPSPQLGILTNVTDKEVESLKKRINSNLKIRLKESSVKVAVGKESMPDKEILENIMSVYNAVFKELPRNKENVKNIKLKFTMTKPQKITLD
jgi:large subunit ribosomal protein L1